MKRIIKRIALILGIIILIPVVGLIGILALAFMQYVREGPRENKPSVRIEYQHPHKNHKKIMMIYRMKTIILR